ncbi:MAG: HAD hydrolase-like protein [Clostridiales bacterium]|nr:HAD hydrolase-like protein [Clostridiales bacterium]
MGLAIGTVLFDLDGTLLDTLGDLAGSLNHTMRRLGYPQRTEGEVRAAIGSGIRNALRRIFPHEPGDGELDAAQAIFREHYAAHGADMTKPYPGIVEALEALARDGYKMAVVSNKPDYATQKLVGAFFSGCIGVAVGERPGVPIKPAPDAVFAALARLGVAAGVGAVGGAMGDTVGDAAGVGAAGGAMGDTAGDAAGGAAGAGSVGDAAGDGSASGAIYVGDSDVDVATAKNAGLPYILVNWGFRDRGALLAAGADPARIACSASELLAMIRAAG